jgi:hypothetical protein
MVLVTGFSLFALQSVTVESVPSPRGVVVSPSQPTYYASPAASCAPASSMPPPMPASYSSSSATCAPAPLMPTPSFPVPLSASAAPSFCPSGEVCSPSVRATYNFDGVSDEPNAKPTLVDSAPSDPPSKASTPSPKLPGAPTDLLDPPSDDEILRALDKAKPAQGGFLHSVERNNVRIVKEKVSDFVDPPSVAPLLGPVQLHHAHYKCTVYYTEITRVGWPASSTVNEDMQDVVYIDHNHLRLAANSVSGKEASY